MTNAGCKARAPLLVLMAALLLSACAGSNAGEEPDRSSERSIAPTATVETAMDAPSQAPSATVERAATSEQELATETAEVEPTSSDQTEEQPAVAGDLAPALGSIDEWHNSAPLALETLRGAPVLLVFWADF